MQRFLTMFFGILRWAVFTTSILSSALSLQADDTNEVEVTCTASAFVSAEGWRVNGAGENIFFNHEWQFDFTQGAASLGLIPADRTLPIRPERFRLQINGSIKGHPIHVFFHTHFMTFHKIVGALNGERDQELVFDAPPGPGWEWFGGENDGKIHGPLRLGEIRLEANGVANRGRVRMINLSAEGKCPAHLLCAMTADAVARPKDQLFEVQMRSLARDNLYGELQWTIRDWQKKVLEQGRKQVILPILGTQSSLSFKANSLKKLQFAEAEFNLLVEGQQPCRALAYWLNPATTKASPQLMPESPFGMGVYLGRYSLEEMEKVAQRAEEGGVKWSREDFHWGAIEPQPGQYQWAYTDRLLDCARRHGITVYAIAAYWPAWAKAYTSEGADQYAQFLRVLVKRYQGQIKQWEIWNEPNIFFWQGTKEQYAELLTKSYKAIKETDPSAQVLGLSTAGIDFSYIEWMLKKDAPFDILTIHPYRKTFDDHAFIADLKKVSDLVQKPSGAKRAVWLTEMGWATHMTHPLYKQDFEANSQRTQAELIARVYLSSIVSGVDPRTFWYDFRDDGDDPYYFEHNMGILRHDNRPKAAFVAYRTLTSMLEGMKFQGSVEAGMGNLAYRFVDPQKVRPQVVVIWNPQQDAIAEFNVPGKRVKVTNTVGEVSQIDTSAISGEKSLRRLHLTLQAGAVVYVQ